MISTDDTKIQKIEKYKRELIHSYIILMSVILLLFAGIFTFFIKDKTMSIYLFGGLFFLIYSYLMTCKWYSINVLVHCYLIIAPLFSFYVMLAFWNNSVASFVWLVPIPLGAYVFFFRKYVILYSLYAILHIAAGYLISNSFDFNFQEHSREDVKMTDTLLFISNVAVISLIIYYKDKIRREELYHEIEKKKEPNTDSRTASTAERELPFADGLFEKIETTMQENQFYKDVNSNISKLSTELGVNSSYISKAIRQNGYPNFNNYLNLYRINCVKRLLVENDLEKVTLMYIYTEAGFSNQSTFNRVFKQIEKITPSEYIAGKQAS